MIKIYFISKNEKGAMTLEKLKLKPVGFQIPIPLKCNHAPAMVWKVEPQEKKEFHIDENSEKE